MLRKFKKIFEYKKRWIATKRKLDIMHIEKPSSNLQIENKFSDCESNGNTVFVLQDQPNSSNFGGEFVIPIYVIFLGLTSFIEFFWDQLFEGTRSTSFI